MTQAAEALSLLPFWVRWAPLVWPPLLSALGCGLGTRVAIAVAAWPWRRFREGPWVERARRAHTVRVASVSAFLLPILCAVCVLASPGFRGSLAEPPVRLVAVLTWLAGSTAALPAASRAEARLLGFARPVPGWWRRAIAQWLVVTPHLLLVLVGAMLMPERMTAGAWAIVALASVALYRLGLGDGLRLARALGLLERAPSRLRDAVQRAAARMGRPAAVAYELPGLHAAAWAWPTPETLIVTSRAVELLGDEELEAVCSHELGHLSESRRTKAARRATMLTLLPVLLLRPLMASFGVVSWMIVLALVAPAGPLVRRWARRLESRADAVAREHEAESGVYARALARLYEINLVPVVLPGSSASHPQLYDRLVAAGAPPEYPRPRPPGRARGLVALALSVLLAMAGLLLVLLLPLFLRTTGDQGESRVFSAMAVNGVGTRQLGALAALRSLERRWDEAGALYRALLELQPENHAWPELLAITLMQAGRCSEARELVRRRWPQPAPTSRPSTPAPEGEDAATWLPAAVAVCRETTRTPVSR